MPETAFGGSGTTATTVVVSSLRSKKCFCEATVLSLRSNSSWLEPP